MLLVVETWNLTESQSDKQCGHFSGLIFSISFIKRVLSQGSQAVISVLLLNLGRYQGRQLSSCKVLVMKHSRIQLL